MKLWAKFPANQLSFERACGKIRLCHYSSEYYHFCRKMTLQNTRLQYPFHLFSFSITANVWNFTKLPGIMQLHVQCRVRTLFMRNYNRASDPCAPCTLHIYVSKKTTIMTRDRSLLRVSRHTFTLPHPCIHILICPVVHYIKPKTLET